LGTTVFCVGIGEGLVDTDGNGDFFAEIERVGVSVEVDVREIVGVGVLVRVGVGVFVLDAVADLVADLDIELVGEIEGDIVVVMLGVGDFAQILC